MYFFILLAFLICERDIVIKCIQYFVDEWCLYVFSSNREVFAFVCLLLSQFDSFLSCLCGLVGLFMLLCRFLVNRAFNSVQLEAQWTLKHGNSCTPGHWARLSPCVLLSFLFVVVFFYLVNLLHNPHPTPPPFTSIVYFKKSNLTLKACSVLGHTVQLCSSVDCTCSLQMDSACTTM